MAPHSLVADDACHLKGHFYILEKMLSPHLPKLYIFITYACKPNPDHKMNKANFCETSWVQTTAVMNFTLYQLQVHM